MEQTKVILVTGASSGIGRFCAEHLAGLGYRVGSFEQRFFTAAKPIIPSGIYESLVMDHYGGKG